jgi:uncharacterized membrane protein
MSEPTPGRRRRASSAAARGALDQPLAKRPGLRLRPHNMDPESLGAFAERFARFMGTARFLVYMTAFVTLWLLWNTVMPEGVRFDPYAFIFLALMLSLQASYAAPLILLSLNRQDDRDKVAMAQDRARNERTLADTEFLTREVAALRLSLGEVATRDFVRSELRDLIEELEERAEERGRRAALAEQAADDLDPPPAPR